MPLRIIGLLLLTSFPLMSNADSAQAIFAGGCFWCMEYEYQELEGVSDVISGFSGGKTDNPTYKGNHKGHFEAVQVTYDPSVVSYPELLSIFWRSIDPFDHAGQFCDKGPSYRTAIFTANDEERALAIEGRDAVSAQFPTETVHTEIRDATGFWPVEEGHQDYYLKNPVRYKYYRWNCGRDQRLKDIWGDSAGH
jgi:peptide-methionine (S)-S-oxide reductase